MTDRSDRADPEDPSSTLPDEPPPDDYQWTAEPEDPDTAGMPAEFVNTPEEDVPGVRRSKGE